MEKDYLLLYSEPDINKYTSIEQLIYALPGIELKNRIVDPVEGCMIFRLHCAISDIALIRAFLDEAGKLENVELFEQRSISW